MCANYEFNAASLEAASLPGSPVGRVCAASGQRRFEGLLSCLLLHCQPRSGQGQGAQRRHQPARATGAAGAHGTPARAGGRAAGGGDAHQHKRRGKARAPPATTRAAGAGAQSEPPSPRVKIPHRGPEQGPTGEGGRRTAPRGGKGASRRAEERPTPPTRPKQRPRAEQGAGRSARRHQEREQRSSTVLTPGRKTTQRARVGRASRRNDSGAGRRPTGPKPPRPARREAQEAATACDWRQGQRHGNGNRRQDAKEPGRPRRASVQAARRTATRRAAKGHPAQRVAVHNWPGASCALGL